MVGLPGSIASPRLVKVYALENNAYVERANITAPAGAPDNSRFGQQARTQPFCWHMLFMNVPGTHSEDLHCSVITTPCGCSAALGPPPPLLSWVPCNVQAQLHY